MGCASRSISRFDELRLLIMCLMATWAELGNHSFPFKPFTISSGETSCQLQSSSDHNQYLTMATQTQHLRHSCKRIDKNNKTVEISHKHKYSDPLLSTHVGQPVPSSLFVQLEMVLNLHQSISIEFNGLDQISCSKN